MPKFLLLLAVIIVSTSTLAQTLYKSIGPDGKTVYSDKPPTEGHVKKTFRIQELPNTAIPQKTLAELEVLRKSSKQSAAPITGVVLFSATWCGYCKQAKAFLAQRGVVYQDNDIDTPSGKLAFAQAGGGKGVPLLIFNGTMVQGFNLASYESYFPTRP